MLSRTLGALFTPAISFAQGDTCSGASRDTLLALHPGGRCATPCSDDDCGLQSAVTRECLLGTSTVDSGFDVPTSLPSPPGGTIQPGTTYNFQCWYRDGASSSFSNVLRYQ